MIVLSGDAKLTANFANNRITNYNVQTTQNKIENNTQVEEQEENKEETKKELTNIDIDVKDASYSELGNYLSFAPGSQKYLGKTIRVRGFALVNDNVIPSGYFAIGKYNISCCAADAEFVGFYVKKDNYTINNNSWYEIEGILEKVKGLDGTDALAINVVNIKEIDSKNEEQYVYPYQREADIIVNTKTLAIKKVKNSNSTESASGTRTLWKLACPRPTPRRLRQ